MQDGFRIATIRGIPIRIHFSFLLVLPLLAFVFSRNLVQAARAAGVDAQALPGAPWLWGLFIALALFASVLLHELAHSLYALRKQGKVRDITLLMIGGVSRLTQPPRDLRHEAMMAFVGPLLSLALGAGLYAAHLFVTQSFVLRFTLFYLGTLNLILGVFNLLPAFPMDGGRVVRALLARRKGLLPATRIAANIGKGFAFVFGVLGFLSFNFILLLIAFFVWVGAEAELRSVFTKAVIEHLTVGDLYSPGVATIAAEASVGEAAEQMRAERRLSLAVVDGAAPPMLVTLDAIRRVAPEARHRTRVRDVAIHTAVLHPSDSAAGLFAQLNDTRAPDLLVSDGERLIGTVSGLDLVRAVKLGELEHEPRRARWQGPRRHRPA